MYWKYLFPNEIWPHFSKSCWGEVKSRKNNFMLKWNLSAFIAKWDSFRSHINTALGFIQIFHHFPNCTKLSFVGRRFRGCILSKKSKTDDNNTMMKFQQEILLTYPRRRLLIIGKGYYVFQCRYWVEVVPINYFQKKQQLGFKVKCLWTDTVQDTTRLNLI